MFYILKMDHNNILGTVLAGGKSQRFGEDKSQVKLAGKSVSYTHLRAHETV